MAIGAIFLLLGIRMFRTVLATTGFIGGAMLSFLLLSQLRTQTRSWGPHGDSVLLGITLLIGCVGAVVGLQLWIVALVAVGGLAGFAVVLYGLTLQGKILSSAPHAPLFHGGTVYMLAGSVLGAVAAVLYERVTIILSTAIIGAMLISSGLDIFVPTGFNQMLQAILGGTGGARLSPGMLGRCYLLLGSTVLLVLLGVTVQACLTNHGHHKPRQ